jgi:hypothetical protein
MVPGAAQAPDIRAVLDSLLVVSNGRTAAERLTFAR